MKKKRTGEKIEVKLLRARNILKESFEEFEKSVNKLKLDLDSNNEEDFCEFYTKRLYYAIGRMNHLLSQKRIHDNPEKYKDKYIDTSIEW